MYEYRVFLSASLFFEFPISRRPPLMLVFFIDLKRIENEQGYFDCPCIGDFGSDTEGKREAFVLTSFQHVWMVRYAGI